MKKIVNLTPHAVNLLNAENKSIRTFESEGVARAAQKTEELGELDGVRLVKMTYGEPVGLPEYQDGVYYIVSALTVPAAKAVGRKVDDLLLTADAVRDEAGRIIGCRAFAVAE